MKLYLPHSFTMMGKDGKAIEHIAGSIASFEDDFGAMLMDRFGATLAEKSDSSHKPNQDENRGSKPSKPPVSGGA